MTGSAVSAHFRRMQLAYCVLVIALIPVALVFFRIRENVHARSEARFESVVNESKGAIERGIGRCVDQMSNLRALFDASASVAKEEWTAYLGSMQVQHSGLGIRSLGYVEMVAPETMATFLREREAAGQSGFAILPAGDRPLYFPVVYLTHFDSAADVIIGLDHAVQPERLAMIREAIDENKATLTQKVSFMARQGASANFGIFAYLPVYRPGLPLETVSQRRAALRGVVYMAIDAETLPGILFEKEQREVAIEVFDGADISGEKLLHRHAPSAANGVASAGFSRRDAVPVLNRRWTLLFTSTPGFDAGVPWHVPWLALSGGLGVALLLFAISWVQVGARARAEHDAAMLHGSEAALVAEKERLAVTLDSITDGVITVDTGGRIVSINKAAENLTGWSRDQALGQSLSDVFQQLHESTRAVLPNPVEKTLQTGITVSPERCGWLRGRDGVERMVADQAAPLRDRAGRVLGAVLVFRDITERRKSEAEMLRESKLESVGLLAGGIAHDFNNILTGIIGNISLARMSSHSTDLMLERLVGVEKAAMRARDLTQQLLTFSKGGAPIRKSTLLPDLVRDTCQFALHGSNVDCEYSLPADGWPVDLDEGQFRQALNHLVINAMQAMPEGGKIEVKLKNVEVTEGFLPPLPAGRYVKLSIRDFGSGIRAEHLPRVFEPYFTTKRHGSGLGLATTYSVVRKHDGQVRVESLMGAGTTFHIYLPATVEAAPAGPDPNQSEFFGRGRLLVMDDEADILEIAGAMLRTFGYEVETAKDGAEAIERYTEARKTGQPFDAVIMDLTVPNGMGGRETIQRLKALDPAVRAIVSSGYSFDPVMASHRQYGFCGVIPKPYRAEDLGRVLQEVLGGPAAG